MQVFGIIPGRHLHAIPHVRGPNQFTLQVNRRPYNCFCDEQQPSHWNTPRKDKLFVLLAPLFSFNIAPESLFHHENPYEKLRICLEYTGMPVDPMKDKSFIFKKFPGWCTWKVEKRNEETNEIFGKVKLDARKIISNAPSNQPLVFKPIQEQPIAEISKRKRVTSKRDKMKGKLKLEYIDREEPTDIKHGEWNHGKQPKNSAQSVFTEHKSSPKIAKTLSTPLGTVEKELEKAVIRTRFTDNKNEEVDRFPTRAENLEDTQ
ncbi:hypothetical protein DICVIV_07805 [Dictyocaulus viviparus]|uniref:Uncharacterized protein n=1 Tax=Dictyocaulus viviparus TaxID=29172 RepID=A0A0D8XNI5_DICVI|nr:hypothetical protein DICVIV_07805 [Dictyocaulus viviparus]